MHNLTLTTQELQIVGIALRKQPYEVVAAVIANIDRQLADHQHGKPDEGKKDQPDTA